MNKLYYSIEQGKHTTFHLLKFLTETEYVLAKSITGDETAYIKKELNNFGMKGFDVMGEPEYTFCGACSSTSNRFSFKVGNQIKDPSNSWVHQDVLTFNVTVLSNQELDVEIFSKRTQQTYHRIYMPATEAEILARCI